MLPEQRKQLIDAMARGDAKAVENYNKLRFKKKVILRSFFDVLKFSSIPESDQEGIEVEERFTEEFKQFLDSVPNIKPNI